MTKRDFLLCLIRALFLFSLSCFTPSFLAKSKNLSTKYLHVHPYATTPAFNAWMLELNVGRGICRHIVRGETFRLLEPPATCQKLTYLSNPYEKQDIVGKDDSELSSCESDDEVPSIINLPLPNPPPSPASAYTLRKRCTNASATSPSSRTSASQPASKALGKRAVVLEEGEEERRCCSEGGQQRGPNRRRTKRRRKHIIELGHTCPEALEGKIRASKPVFSHLVTESLPMASGAWVGMDSQFYGAKKVRMVEDLLAKGMWVIRYEKGKIVPLADSEQRVLACFVDTVHDEGYQKAVEEMTRLILRARQTTLLYLLGFLDVTKRASAESKSLKPVTIY
ncbi:hypothetical protein C8J55DRAFT_490744 [Lentinula edodes]|uniref:Uncharacterized protein n=1 Tax=Lentinula lateritia TaxID=40482 RepID=A0A9W9A6S1_9AGAR|nr:hypothetical protein C8J55DRAFT_490744 [Lentinula edodes]